jgi:hypothetical protein
MNDHEPLSRIAEAVTDGKEICWSEEEQKEPRHKERIRKLRALTAIRDAHHRETSKTEGLRLPERTLPTTPPPPEAPPLFRWGRLEVQDLLAGGGYGEVYRARDPSLQIDVALKLLHASPGTDPEELLREARHHARVHHPNVVGIHGADQDGDQVGLWMPLIEGRTLEQVLQEQGPLGAEEAARIGIDLCRALAAVHGAGLLHRDVKTANVMREKGGRIILMDFSSARDRAPGEGLEGEIVGGTPLFMAPELFAGRPTSVASDLYSLGVVLYRLVTGSFPYHPRTFLELRITAARGDRTLLTDARSDLPPAFVQVVEQALESDPAKRFPSAGAMERALVAAMGGPAAAPAAPAPKRRSVMLLAVGAVLALVAVGAWTVRPLLGPPLEVEATLLRSRDGIEERLPSRGAVQVGDRIFMEMRGSRSMHVFVFNEDDAGNRYLLFPLPGLVPGNPLPEDAVHRLPGEREGRNAFWTVTSAGGSERIYVVATTHPRPDLAGILATLPAAGTEAAVPLPGGIVEPLRRGLGGVSYADAEPAESEATLADMARRLSRQAARDRGLWVWEAALESGDRR